MAKKVLANHAKEACGDECHERQDTGARRVAKALREQPESLLERIWFRLFDLCELGVFCEISLHLIEHTNEAPKKQNRGASGQGASAVKLGANYRFAAVLLFNGEGPMSWTSTIHALSSTDEISTEPLLV